MLVLGDQLRVEGRQPVVRHLQMDRAYVDRGYRGHGADKHCVFHSRQKRGVTPTIQRETRRRAGIEPASSR